MSSTEKSSLRSAHIENSENFFPGEEEKTRIWIHPLYRDIAPNTGEPAWIESRLKELTQTWTAHQKPVPGKFFIHRNRFVIIANPHEVSGCGIDTSFRALSEINRYLGGEVENLVYYLSGDQVKSLPRYRVKAAVAAKEILPHTPIINPQLTLLRELREGLLELPAEKSFLAHHFTR